MLTSILENSIQDPGSECVSVPLAEVTHTSVIESITLKSTWRFWRNICCLLDDIFPRDTHAYFSTTMQKHTLYLPQAEDWAVAGERLGSGTRFCTTRDPDLPQYRMWHILKQSIRVKIRAVAVLLYKIPPGTFHHLASSVPKPLLGAVKKVRQHHKVVKYRKGRKLTLFIWPISQVDKLFLSLSQTTQFSCENNIIYL